MADYRALSIYDTFELEYVGWGDFYYGSIIEQQITMEDNPYLFTRYELGVGYSFQVSKNISLDIDLNLTQRPQNKGALPDVVFARIGDEPFVKVYEEPYRDSRLNFFGSYSNLLMRVKLIYHFTK